MTAATLAARGTGPLVLAAAMAAALALFAPGVGALLAAWATPEYSHGPLIPVVSALLFWRERSRRSAGAPAGGAWPGFALLALAALAGGIGAIAGIADVSAYGLILWVAGLAAATLGWRRALGHWASIGHLVFMLPLPQVVWWQANLALQGLSAEIGVALIAAMGVPVWLDGHVIDLGVWRLEVAEACSGLRYLFPILSFAVLVAALFRGPLWGKAILVLAAAPVAVALNAARIAAIGYAVDARGIEMAQGVLHAFQGWVVFGGCLALLAALAWALGRLARLDGPLLDLDGIAPAGAWAALRAMRPGPALPAYAAATALAALALAAAPRIEPQSPARLSFAAFPSEIGGWRGLSTPLPADIAAVLGADDYLDMALLDGEGRAPVNLFAAWYRSQTDGAGLHSPEVCLPAGGWEIAALERRRIAPPGTPYGAFEVNRAEIVRGGERRLVYYWFEQRGARMTDDRLAKLTVLRDALLRGRTDGALVRVMTPMRGPGDDADARLVSALAAVLPRLPDHVPF